MSRDCYETTVALPDATGVLKALAGVKVSVVPRAAQDVPNSLVDVFVSDTGATRGPDPKCGATGTNPMTTSASGAIRFWAEGPYEYDLVFEDTQAPARIADRVGWNAVPAKAGSIPTSFLAEDAGITQKMLGPVVVRQQVPIGCVIEWWRPAASGAAVPYPDGFEVADGHAVTQHDFPGITGGIAVPNLQNVFILGASTNKADGAGAAQTNAATDGPGIRGPGGSNAGRNLAHGHTTPQADHWHYFDVPNHYHLAGALTTADHLHSGGSLYVNGHNRYANAQWGGSNEAHALANSISGIGGGTTGAADRTLTVGGNTDWVSGANRSTTLWLSSSSGIGNVASNGTTWTADPGTDFRPQFYGLLRLIKVRRA